jgi:hypothetical protein
MAFKTINDTAGPDGLVPTLLIYSAYLRMTEYDAPTPTITQRALAVKKAIADLQRVRAKEQVQNALNTRNSPSTTALYNLLLNSDVLIWREGNVNQKRGWDGSYKLLSINGETCVLALPRGLTDFRSTAIKPYFKDIVDDLTAYDLSTRDLNTRDLKVHESTDNDEASGTVILKDTITVDVPQPEPQKRGRGRPRKPITVYLQEDDNTYVSSRKAEIQGLLEKGVFKIISKSDVPQGTRIFNSRFVDTTKNSGTSAAFAKSRLVVQAYNDGEKKLVLTQSPTIQRISQRLILCIAAIKNNPLYLRDISQAYVQSATELIRNFYINPPEELAEQLNLTRNHILRVVKPLYGVPEAGAHWFETYQKHHLNKLGMGQSTYDPCLLLSFEPFGVVGLQTDDTLFTADDAFAELERTQLKDAGFLAKEREVLSPEHLLKFNRGLITLTPNGISLT